MPKSCATFSVFERVIVQIAGDHRLGAKDERSARRAAAGGDLAQAFAERRGDQQQARLRQLASGRRRDIRDDGRPALYERQH